MRSGYPDDVRAGLPIDRELRILIVDDDDLDRERIRRVLRRMPLRTLTVEAATGAEAILALRGQAIDCVLLDHRLGDTTGSALIHQLRERASYEGPVVMVTGAGSESLVVEAMQEGASDYVPKVDLDPERLLRAIVRSIERRLEISEEKATSRRLTIRVAEQARTLRELGRTLQDVLDHAPSVIAYWDRNEHVRFGNVAHQDWFGLSQKQLSGRSAREVLGDELYALHAPHIRAALHGESRQFEHPMPARGGRPARIVRVEYRPDVDEHGETQGFYVTLTDTTELATARNAAQESARLKSTFLANMSHEVRTPMNAIVGLLQVTLSKPLGAEVRGDVARAHDAARALLGLLDDVLDHSKLESGQLRFAPEPLRVDEVVARSVELFSGNVAQKQLDLRVEIDDDVPLALQMDGLRISQVLNNLVGNAVKFTERGAVSIAVRWRSASGRLRIEVGDTGPGIALERRSELFSAFVQEDATVARRHGGSGLGLSICRELVDRMGGEIGMTSGVGSGSTFWFEVPLEPCAPPDDLATPARRTTLFRSASPEVPRLWRRISALDTDRWIPCTDLRQLRDRLRDPKAVFDLLVVNWTGKAEALDEELEIVARDLRALGARAPSVVFAIDERVRASVARRTNEFPGAPVLTHPVMATSLLRALPPARPAAAPRDEEGPRAPAEDATSLQGRRALLVEDHALNQIVARAYLERLGIEVTVVADGSEAVEFAASTDPSRIDVVLMDMHMPEMDGPEATRRIRAMPEWRAVPIIAMTAAVMKDDRARCADAGMVDVITKPILAENLERTLKQHLGPRGSGA